VKRSIANCDAYTYSLFATNLVVFIGRIIILNQNNQSMST